MTRGERLLAAEELKEEVLQQLDDHHQCLQRISNLQEQLRSLSSVSDNSDNSRTIHILNSKKLYYLKVVQSIIRALRESLDKAESIRDEETFLEKRHRMKEASSNAKLSDSCSSSYNITKTPVIRSSKVTYSDDLRDVTDEMSTSIAYSSVLDSVCADDVHLAGKVIEGNLIVEPPNKSFEGVCVKKKNRNQKRKVNNSKAATEDKFANSLTESLEHSLPHVSPEEEENLDEYASGKIGTCTEIQDCCDSLFNIIRSFEVLSDYIDEPEFPSEQFRKFSEQSEKNFVFFVDSYIGSLTFRKSNVKLEDSITFNNTTSDE